jgi:hypothetical protein
MESELKGTNSDPQPEWRRPQTEFPSNLPKIDIALIGAAGFDRHLRRKETQIFTISLYELDHLIQLKAAQREMAHAGRLNMTDDEIIKNLLPAAYYDLKHVFSKAASD